MRDILDWVRLYESGFGIIQIILEEFDSNMFSFLILK